MQSKEEGTCFRCHQALSRGVVSAEGEPPRVVQFSKRQSWTGIHVSPQLVCNIMSSFLSFPSWKWPKCFRDIRLEPKEFLVLQFRSDRITAISCDRPNTGPCNPHDSYLKFHISQLGRLISRAKESIRPRSTARTSPSWVLNPCLVCSQCP